MALIHLSPCQRIAQDIAKEAEMLSGIDCRKDVSVMNKVGILEGRRMIINRYLDEMAGIIKASAPTATTETTDHEPVDRGDEA